VPEEQDIAVGADRRLVLDKAGPKISQYDLNAVEAAVELAAAAGGSTVTTLSVGGKKYLENSKVRKDLLSRGPDSLTAVIDDSLAGSLGAATAEVLAGAAQKVGFDLILCGEGSGDLYAQQVGLLLGEKLGVASINAVSKIELNGSSLTVERSLEEEVEVLEVPLPAVISVTTDINTPKIPSMKAILGAGKKPVNVLALAEVCPAPSKPAEMKSILAPEQADRLHVIIEGDSDDNIAAFVENVRKALN
jgi:electron transfer flavoprotein beta subunit